MIDQNNRRYTAAGDTRYAVGNAPAREAHFVVRGGDRIAMLSVLNIATACKTIAADAADQHQRENVSAAPRLLARPARDNSSGAGLLFGAGRATGEFHAGPQLCRVIRIL